MGDAEGCHTRHFIIQFATTAVGLHLTIALAVTINTSPPITRVCAIYDAQNLVRNESGSFLSSDGDGYPEAVEFDRLIFIYSGIRISETYEDDRDRYSNPLNWTPSANGYTYSIGELMGRNGNVVDYQICRERN